MNISAALLTRGTGSDTKGLRHRLTLPLSLARARVAALPTSPPSCAHILASAPGCVTAVALEPVEERILLVADTRACVRLYDTCRTQRGGPPLSRGTPDAVRAHSRAVTSVAWYARDGNLFVSGGADGRVVVWDATGGSRGGGASVGGGVSSSTLRAVSRIDVISSSLTTAAATITNPAAAVGRVHCVAMSPCAATHALVACGTDSGVRLIDLVSGAAAHELVGSRSAILAVAWAPAHEYLLAAGSRDGTIRLFDVRSAGRGATLAVLDDDASPAAAVAVAAASARGIQPPRLPRGVLESLGVPFREEAGITGRRSSVSVGAGAGAGAGAGVDADARTAAIAHGEGGVNGLLWATRGGGGGGGGGADGADFLLWSTGADGKVRAWGIGLVETMRGGGGGGGEYNDDAANLLTGHSIKGAAGWHLAREFRGVANRARRCVGFTVARAGPNHMTLFHPAADGALGAWDVSTGARLGTLRAHAGTINTIVTKKMSGEVFSGGDDGVVIRWVGGNL